MSASTVSMSGGSPVGTQNRYRQWLWCFRTNIGIQPGHETVRPQQGITIIEDHGGSPHHRVIAVTEQFGLTMSFFDTDSYDICPSARLP